MSRFPGLARSPLWMLFQQFLAVDAPSWVPQPEQDAWREEVAAEIARSGKHGLDFLLQHLKQVDESRVRAILTSLAFLNRRLLTAKNRSEIKARLLALLGHHDPLVIADAIDALRILDFHDEIGTIQRLLDDPSPYIGGSVLRFLRQHSPESVRPLLESALKSSDPIIRQNGVDELDELDSIESLPRLRELLDDPDEDVRQAARTTVAHLEELQQSHSLRKSS
ncbi:MAG: HEAT repeat domain-containing protein [Gemmataceae bacterium]|nr:HEAT repeat domain-containing protein [Gemmataceae bacterium]